MLGDWAYYGLVTPLMIGLGAASAAYCTRVVRSLRPGGAARTTALQHAPVALLGVLVAASIFWATATVAQWSGRGCPGNDSGQLRALSRTTPLPRR